MRQATQAIISTKTGPFLDFLIFLGNGNSKGGCAGRRVNRVYAPDLAAGVSSHLILVWAPVFLVDVCTVRWRPRAEEGKADGSVT